MNNLPLQIETSDETKHTFIYSHNKKVANIAAKMEKFLGDFLTYKETAHIYIHDDNIKDVNGIKVIQIYAKKIFQNSASAKPQTQFDISWIKLDDFLNKEKKNYYNTPKYPSKVFVTKSVSTTLIHKNFMINSRYDNCGDYDYEVIVINKETKNKKIDKCIMSGHSFIRATKNQVFYDLDGNLKGYYFLWKMNNKTHRFNGPAIEEKDIERYTFLGKDLPEGIIRFKDDMPSKELSNASVLEAILFDRDYGKVIETVYKTQKIPTEQEVFDIIGRDHE